MMTLWVAANAVGKKNGALITTIIGLLGPSPAEGVDRVTCLNNHLSFSLTV